jgi:hypothetical protein
VLPPDRRERQGAHLIYGEMVDGFCDEMRTGTDWRRGVQGSRKREREVEWEEKGRG